MGEQSAKNRPQLTKYQLTLQPYHRQDLQPQDLDFLSSEQELT